MYVCMGVFNVRYQNDKRWKTRDVEKSCVVLYCIVDEKGEEECSVMLTMKEVFLLSYLRPLRWRAPASRTCSWLGVAHSATALHIVLYCVT